MTVAAASPSTTSSRTFPNARRRRRQVRAGRAVQLPARPRAGRARSRRHGARLGTASVRRLGGELWRELDETHVAVEDVDIVAVSHGHLDHIGGLTKDGRPAFPRARYVIAEGEWSYWTSASVLDELSEAVATPARQQLPPLEAAGVVDRVSGEVELTDGVRLLPAPGHSPAHAAVEIGETGGLLFAVDALLHPLQVEHPDWGRGLDHDPELAIESRHSLLARAAERGHVVTGSHWDTAVTL